MINLFTISANDQSVFYLGQIFGYVGNLLPAQSASLLLGIMFKFLNSIALTIGAFIVVYVTVVGLIATAHEGEFMGKKWSGLWVPLRTVGGIAALFPTATGYSAIQVIFMWVILQGVGAADTLWTNVINYVAQTGSPTSGVNVGSINTTDTQRNIKKLFQGLLCQAEMRIVSPDITLSSGGAIPFYCEATSVAPYKDFCKRSQGDMLNILTGPQRSANSPVYSMGDEGLCGTLVFCDASTKDDHNTNSQCITFQTDAQGNKIVPGKVTTDSLSCLSCKAQQAALQNIVSTYGAIAQQIASIDYLYILFSEQGMKNPPDWVLSWCTAQDNIPPEQCCIVPPGPGKTCKGSFPSDVADAGKGAVEVTNTSDDAAKVYYKYALGSMLQGNNFVDGALGTYLSGIVGAVSEWLQKQNPELKDWQKEAVRSGWIMAGAYYFKMADSDQKVIQATQPPLAVTDMQSLSKRNNYKASQAILNELANQSQSTASFAGGGPQYAGVSEALDNTKGTLLRTMISNMSGHWGTDVSVTKPLSSLASYGYSLMITAQILFVVLTAIAMAIAGFASLNFMVIGSGLTMNPFGEAIKAGVALVGPFFVILVVSLYTLGATLGIYVPLIPVVVFTVGAIGWMIATIEAMVAAPIVALGILSPGGQHEILGRAEPALMLLFNLFLRPSLMILGLMAATLVSIAVVNLINAGFLSAVSSIMTAPGLFEEIMFIAAYTSLIITALNKTFSLIYVVPERVLTWIGGPAVQYGEGEALGAMKHGVEGAAGTSTGAGKESAAGGSQGAGARGHAQALEQNKEDLDKRAGAGAAQVTPSAAPGTTPGGGGAGTGTGAGGGAGGGGTGGGTGGAGGGTGGGSTGGGTT